VNNVLRQTYIVSEANRVLDIGVRHVEWLVQMSDRMIYVFILGKNWKLSVAELVSFLKSRAYTPRIIDISKSFVVIELENALDPSIAVDLGGTIKIGRVITEIPVEIVNKAFLERDKQARNQIQTSLSLGNTGERVFDASKAISIFGVSVYSVDTQFSKSSIRMQRFLGSYFKKNLASRGEKAKFMGFPKSRYMPQLTHVEVLKKGLVENSAEILFCIGKEEAFLSKTMAVHNPFEFQKRDVERPFQRKIFSISPRLAKILVNLSMCLPENRLLDPFCGVGTIIQEAALMQMEVIGVDKDSWCVKAARANLAWLEKEYSSQLKGARSTILLGDARSLTNQIETNSVDAIATEPPLGPALRYIPTISRANRIIGDLKSLYYDFLEEAYKVLKSNGHLAIVSPCIRTRTCVPVYLDIDKKAELDGFKKVYPVKREDFMIENKLVEELTRQTFFTDAEERHKIVRQIHIFQK
jgi:tRNA G10  N-methylase Trm11